MAFSSYSSSGFGFPNSLPPKPPTPYSFQGLRQEPNHRSSSDDEVIFNREQPVFNSQLKTIETVKRESQPPSMPTTTQSMPYAPPTQIAPFFSKTAFNPPRLTFGTLNYANMSNQPPTNNGSLFAQPFTPRSNVNNPWNLSSHQSIPQISQNNGSPASTYVANAPASKNTAVHGSQGPGIRQFEDSNELSKPNLSEKAAGKLPADMSTQDMTANMTGTSHKRTVSQQVDNESPAPDAPAFTHKAKRQKTTKAPQPAKTGTIKDPKSQKAKAQKNSASSGPAPMPPARILSFSNLGKMKRGRLTKVLIGDDHNIVEQFVPSDLRQMISINNTPTSNLWYGALRYVDSLQGVHTVLPDPRKQAWAHSSLLALHEIIFTDSSFDVDTALKEKQGCLLMRYVSHIQEEYKARKARDMSAQMKNSVSGVSATPALPNAGIGFVNAPGPIKINNDKASTLTAEEVARIDRFADQNSKRQSASSSIFQTAREMGQAPLLNDNAHQPPNLGEGLRYIESLGGDADGDYIRETSEGLAHHAETTENPSDGAEPDLTRTHNSLNTRGEEEIFSSEAPRTAMDIGKERVQEPCNLDDTAQPDSQASAFEENPRMAERDTQPTSEDQPLPLIKREPSYVRADIITNVRRPSPVRSGALALTAEAAELDIAMEELQAQIIRGMTKHVDWEDPRIALWETEMSVRRISKALEKAKDAYAAQAEVED